MSATHRRAVLAEFSHQAEAFNRSPTMTSDQTLRALVDLLPAKAGERWLEVACGPGLVARGLAPRVGGVVAGDVTPRMLALGRREARAAGGRHAEGARPAAADGRRGRRDRRGHRAGGHA